MEIITEEIVWFVLDVVIEETVIRILIPVTLELQRMLCCVFRRNRQINERGES